MDISIPKEYEGYKMDARTGGGGKKKSRSAKRKQKKKKTKSSQMTPTT